MEERYVATTSEGSSVNVTDDREAYPRHWYVARVQMKCEKKSASKITASGYETFVPVQKEIRQWSDRKKKIDKILIPLVVFFKADERGAKEVEKLSFVYGLLRAPGERKAATIPDNQICRLKFMIGNCDDEIAITTAPIIEGDKVRVVRGSLKGLEGYAITSSEGKAKISIVIDNLCCASVKITPSDLIKI